MKTLLGLMLALTSMLSVQAAEEARIDVSGNLIAPPCTPRFAASQQVTLGQANINQLLTDNVASTDVPLIFDCQADSRVSLTFSAGSGSVGTNTLLTDRAELGLRLSLLNKNTKTDFSLGQANSWEVDDEPLELTLQVKPVSLGELPEAGSYSAMLLMQLIYR